MAATEEFAVRRSARARRVRVRIDPDGSLLVTLPSSADEREAAEAVAQLEDWIASRRRKLREAHSVVARPSGTLPHLGELLTVVREPGRSRAHRDGERLLVPADERREAAVERWYRRSARAEVLLRLEPALEALGVQAGPISIRDQRTRWGSCSSSGALAFNWRLLLGPPELLDYVVWHEACHLVVLDHSERFWRLLESYRPDYRSPRDWLRRNGAALHL
ncbi:MAG: DUF45 domain-containing protein [Actinobacteria bacterium]|uniref:Unannotated protein n=1 Tax=freshwater metagenome TaxID=449393 RepID=A0A6J5Z5A4_9ZZZZ|nr:DUF45 domain-containing protein [Actinomycetota bacterium]